MIKLKLICENPPNAPFGTREECSFIKIPSSTHYILLELAREKNISLEEAIKYVLTEEVSRQDNKNIVEREPK